MDWTYLGHAMWHARVGELRLLFDPQLDGRHFGDVFEVRPRRRIDVDALAADFIFVSHRHPDHFDVPSLHRLARIDRESVVITSDPLVERTCETLGFAKVARVDAPYRIELEGARLMTTPSAGEVLEWGVIVASAEGVAWNQVDTVHTGAGQVAAILRDAAQALERPALEQRLDLGLVSWQPLLEIQAAIGERIGFPVQRYAALLDEIAALSAGAVVPASAGVRHAHVHDFMNRLVYPLPMRRFLRDLASRCPATRGLAAVIGARYRLHAGEVERDMAADTTMVQVEDDSVPELFRPLEIPPIFDPNIEHRDEGALRDRVERWALHDLAPALGRIPESLTRKRPLTLVLEVVFPVHSDAYTFVVDGAAVRVQRRFDDDYDVLNVIAGSWLVDVIEGRRHWGEPLLGGLLRASHRAYRADETGLARLDVAVMFLYYALPYDLSHERAVAHQLRELGVTAA